MTNPGKENTNMSLQTTADQYTFGKFAPIKGGKSFQAELARALSLVLDIEGRNQMYHAWRVGVLSARLAAMLDPELKAPLSYAGLLHDIGAVGIDDHVAYHPNQEDQKAIPWLKSHPLRGAEIMGEIPGMWQTVPHVLNHHERYDGRGYPRGQYGARLALGAQIIRAADSAELKLRRLKAVASEDYLAAIARLTGTEIGQEVGDAAKKLFSDNGFSARWADTKTLPGMVDSMLAETDTADLVLTTDEIGSSLRVFASIIDAKHQYTAGHSQRVAKYGVRLALGLDLPREQALLVRHSGLLHDIGKVSVPSSLLDKPASLTEQEYDYVKKHPLLTIEVLSTVSALSPLAPIAGGHHEHYDGSGYPFGLSGDNIPIEARILAVADAFDAITSDRAYRKAQSSKKAVGIIERDAGSHFDPKVVAAAPLLIE